MAMVFEIIKLVLQAIFTLAILINITLPYTCVFETSSVIQGTLPRRKSSLTSQTLTTEVNYIPTWFPKEATFKQSFIKLKNGLPWNNS